jgi:uncharacterized protein (DUF488 family)
MRVYTLGYEKRNIVEFVDLLRQLHIQILIDVRETAWSYKKDFCKTSFKETLLKNGIQYVHVKDLGNPKTLRKSDEDRRKVLGKYKKYLEETEAGIFELMGIIEYAKKSKSNICLTCYERAHSDCHRSLIVNHIKSLVSINITHLL